MKRIVIYHTERKTLVVLEKEEIHGNAIILIADSIAMLPAGKGQTARMMGEVVGSVHGIPVAWERSAR